MNHIKIEATHSVRQVIECPSDGLSVSVEQSASLDLLIVCRGYNGGQKLSVTLHCDSTMNLTMVDLENLLLERTVNIDLNGAGAHCDVKCIALCSGSECNVNRIVMNHNVGNCTSNQTFRSVAAGSSQITFNGLIYVAPDAQGTEALQQSRNILLSDTARVDTQPQLEIYADDVKCNHGAATGRFDDNAIYYMRQRGIELGQARTLLLQGFCLQILGDGWIDEKPSLAEDISDRLSKL